MVPRDGTDSVTKAGPVVVPSDHMGVLDSRRALYVAVLLAGRLADSATTRYGLAQPGVYESNPVVAWQVARFGPDAGLLVANVLAIGLVVGLGELGVRLSRRRAREDDGDVGRVLALCYLPYAVVSFGAALHNLRVIAAA